jgi:putative transposase
MRVLLNLVTVLLYCALAVFRSRSEQAIVESGLRQQLATYTQRTPKPRLSLLDRALWVVLFRFWPRWKEALVIVKPATVVGWHRKGFRLYWRSISKRGPGRPAIADEVRGLIRRFREAGFVDIEVKSFIPGMTRLVVGRKSGEGA